MDELSKSDYDAVLPKCPLDKFIPNFPCPGPHKHQLLFYEDNPSAPCGRGEALCRLGAFCNLRYVGKPTPNVNYLNGTLQLLNKTLLGIASCNVDAIVQLGGIFDSTHLETNGELHKMVNELACEFNQPYTRVFHVIGDMEAAVRTEYVNSFFGETAKKLDKTSGCVRCCGNLFYSAPIGPEYTLVVIDGYELLVVDPQTHNPVSSVINSEATGEGFQFKCKLRDPKGQRCSMHETPCTTRIGWPHEIQSVGGYMTPSEFNAMPRLRTAVSRSQLRWLDHTLLNCLHTNQNVVIACHAPLHPLLVRDRSTLILNWMEILKVIMQYSTVRLVLCGRQVGEGSEPIPGTFPYTRDHGILYFSMPSVCETLCLRNSSSVNLIADLGYDFVRVRGEGLGLSQADRECGCFSSFRPKQKLSVNEKDYSFNGAFMQGI